MGLTPPEVEAGTGHREFTTSPRDHKYTVTKIFTVLVGHAHILLRSTINQTTQG
jgi:hypothetical protein